MGNLQVITVPCSYVRLASIFQIKLDNIRPVPFQKPPKLWLRKQWCFFSGYRGLGQGRGVGREKRRRRKGREKEDWRGGEEEHDVFATKGGRERRFGTRIWIQGSDSGEGGRLPTSRWRRLRKNMIVLLGVIVLFHSMVTIFKGYGVVTSTSRAVHW